MVDDPQNEPLAGAGPPADPAASGGRRRVRRTRRSFITLAVTAVAGIAAYLKFGLDGGSTSGGRTAGGAQSRLGGFPVNTADSVPSVPADQWVVTVDGLVEQSLRLDRAAWLALARRDETVDFHCVEGWTVDNVAWGGVSPATLFAAARPQPAGKFVTFHAYGGVYTDSLTMAEAMQAQTLLADTIDGAALPPEHGGPLRLVVPDQMGYKSVKWVQRIEVTDKRATGYWEKRGYPGEAPV